MKKLLIATALTTFALTTQAEGLYLQADAGYSGLTATVDGQSGSNGTSSQRLGLGYDFGNQFRLAVDYTNFGKIKEEYAGINASLKVKSVGATAFYEFNKNSKWVPYFGVRVARNTLKATIDGSYSAYGYYTSHIDTEDSESVTGVGAILGGQYKFTPNVALNIGLEYNRIGGSLSLNEASIKAGFRIGF